jgi:hypothetical protein
MMRGKVIGLPFLLVHQRFEQQASDAPEDTALVYEDGRWSYGMLNQRSNQLANHLCQGRAGPGTPHPDARQHAGGSLPQSLFRATQNLRRDGRADSSEGRGGLSRPEHG